MIGPEGQSKAKILEVRDTDNESLLPDGLKRAFAQLLKEIPGLHEKIELTRYFLQLMLLIDPDSVDGLFDIKIIERNQNRPPSEDCFTYLVGRGVDVQGFHDEMFATHTLSEEPVPGAYALYLRDEANVLKAAHIGRVTDDLTVISKWGLSGHVYKHLPALVPISYGSRIAYYVPQKTRK